jgi:hypothetical protein
MPGLPMFGHGQIEGFHEKYGMEYKRAYWDEQVDEGLVRGHDMWIFPLLRRRWLFSGSENFVLYDFYTADGSVDENVFAYSNRVGEHRGLVLYHNRHATTSGWINASAAFLVPGEDEGGRLARTTLAEALAIPDEDGVYLAFRDQTEGLEYLRSERELREQGLYVELKEYQFHVFMDFKVIRDDAEGSWHDLYTHLNGSGVASLDDERKQVRYAELNAMFRTIFDLVFEDRDNAAITTTDAGLQQAVALFQQAADTHIAQAKGKRIAGAATGKRKLSKRESVAIAKAAIFTELKLHSTTAAAAHSFLLRLAAAFSDQAAESLLLAWLLLRETEVDPVNSGLDFTLRRFVRRDGDPDFSSRATELLSALLQWWRSSERVSAASNLKQLQALFALPAGQAFLQHHVSEGVAWFNKERFEELHEWLTLLLLIDECKTPLVARTVTTKMGEAERALIAGAKLAQDVGYRSRLFEGLPDKGEVCSQSVQKKKS